jgi:hypothetical protein
LCVLPVASALDLGESTKLLKKAERQLFEIKKSQPKPVAKRAEHRGNPLVDQTCTFKARVSYYDVADDERHVVVCVIRRNLSALYPIGDIYPNYATMAEQTDIAVKQLRLKLREIRARPRGIGRSEQERVWLGKLRDAEKARRDLRESYDAMVKRAEHELRIKLPSGTRPPLDLPNRVEATVLVSRVEWRQPDKVPTFIIHADLVKSDDLNLSASGVLDDSKQE